MSSRRLGEKHVAVDSLGRRLRRRLPLFNTQMSVDGRVPSGTS